MKELLTLLCDYLERTTPVVLATVIHQEGSTPRGVGSKMLVNESGLISGTIGGGLAEGEALVACKEALATGKARILHFTLTGEMAAKSEMICGGLLHIFIEPIAPTAENRSFYRQVLDHIDTSETLVLTSLHTHDLHGEQNIQRYLCLDGVWTAQSLHTDAPPLSLQEKDAFTAELQRGQETAFIPSEQGHIIMEKYPPVWKMIILGGGHVSLFTAQVAALAGFSVTVMDDRAEFSSAERFPQAAATYTVPEFTNCFALCPPSKYTCIVIVTRGHLHDKTVLEQSLATQAGYIGMIGSKRKREQVYDALKEQGFTQERLNTVYCPIGLGIKAETPEEIAVSIVAQCIAHRREAWDILPQ